MTTTVELRILPDRQSLAQAAAGQVIALAKQAIERKHIFRIMLSGGSTTRSMHQVLSQPDHAVQIDWAQVQIFWGDERCVPPDHLESNYQMAAETLLKYIPIPSANIHRIRGELPPRQAAADYQRQIAEQYNLETNTKGQPVPRFDLILLGLGSDGHTASLFPGSEALAEKHLWVTCLAHDHPPEPLIPRVTVTLPVIQQAHQVMYLVAGVEKANRLAQVLKPTTDTPLPAHLARPCDGILYWMVDRAAASRLD